MSLLVEFIECLTSKRLQENPDVFYDRFKILDALLDWDTCGLELLQALDLVTQGPPGGVKLGGSERDYD